MSEAVSMIERVACILEPQAWAALETGDTLAYKNRRTSSLRKARAALTAMREPTDAMVDAGYNTFEEAYDPEHCYSMMIDAALNEQVAG